MPTLYPQAACRGDDENLWPKKKRNATFSDKYTALQQPKRGQPEPRRALAQTRPVRHSIKPSARALGRIQQAPRSPKEQNLPASVRFRDRHFFELGRGGVDFPAILQVLNDASWKGWMTVELDSTVTTAKGSCTVRKQYLERVLKLKV